VFRIVKKITPASVVVNGDDDDDDECVEARVQLSSITLVLDVYEYIGYSAGT